MAGGGGGLMAKQRKRGWVAYWLRRRGDAEDRDFKSQ